jgi:hypothetical protein
VLRIEPGREDDFAYWHTTLAVNRAVMEAIEATELPYDPTLTRRPFPASLRRPRRQPAREGRAVVRHAFPS